MFDFFGILRRHMQGGPYPPQAPAPPVGYVSSTLVSDIETDLPDEDDDDEEDEGYEMSPPIRGIEHTPGSSMDNLDSSVTGKHTFLCTFVIISMISFLWTFPVKEHEEVLQKEPLSKPLNHVQFGAQLDVRCRLRSFTALTLSTAGVAISFAHYPIHCPRNLGFLSHFNHFRIQFELSMDSREKKKISDLFKKLIKTQSIWSETANDMIYSHIKLQFNSMCT